MREGEALGRSATTEAVHRDQRGLGKEEFGGVKSIGEVLGVVLIYDGFKDYCWLEIHDVHNCTYRYIPVQNQRTSRIPFKICSVIQNLRLQRLFVLVPREMYKSPTDHQCKRLLIACCIPNVLQQHGRVSRQIQLQKHIVCSAKSEGIAKVIRVGEPNSVKNRVSHIPVAELLTCIRAAKGETLDQHGRSLIERAVAHVVLEGAEQDQFLGICWVERDPVCF